MKDDASGQEIFVAATERAQREIGRELHETVCQSLAGVAIFVDFLARRCRGGERIGEDALEELSRHLHTGIDQARALYRKYEPRKLDESGFLEALENLARLTSSSRRCDFVCEKPVFVRDPEAALALYRIAQEAVKNAIMHSHANTIRIELNNVNGAVELNVCDNGRGFNVPPVAPPWGGLGLMKAYAESAGAELSIRSAVGQTVISAKCRQRT